MKKIENIRIAERGKSKNKFLERRIVVALVNGKVATVCTEASWSLPDSATIEHAKSEFELLK